MSKELHISKDLVPIFEFIIHIANEVSYAVSGKDTAIDDFYSGWKNLLDGISELDESIFTETIAKKIDTSNLEKNSKFAQSNKPSTHRANMQVIFSYLETLKTLWNAYHYKTDEYAKLISLSKDKNEEFINKFLLSEKNEFYLKHKNEFYGIKAKMLIDLRNSLAHFFSIGSSSIIIGPKMNQKFLKATEIVKEKTKKEFFILDSDIFFNLVEGAGGALLTHWENDSRSKNFSGIEFVKNIVKKYGAKMIHEDQLNI